MSKQESVIFMGAHPDDFLGCAGTALLMRGLFSLHIWDYTHGERGLEDQGISMAECTQIRFREEMLVAETIGAEVRFFDEIDGEAFAGRETCEKMAESLARLRPRAVFTHWFPDRHPDHCACTCALLKAVRLAGISPEIYFYEETSQSIGFSPRWLVDISSVMEEKIKIARTYVCQNTEDILVRHKTADAVFRGSQILAPYAEAFAGYDFIRKHPAPSIFQQLPCGTAV